MTNSQVKSSLTAEQRKAVEGVRKQIASTNEDKEGSSIAKTPHGGLWNLKEAIQNGQDEETFASNIIKELCILEKMVVERDDDVDCEALISDLSNLAYDVYFQ